MSSLASATRFEPHRVQSGMQGLYEVSTGLVAMHASPSSKARTLGMLRGGCRFVAVPHQVGRATWLLLHSAGGNDFGDFSLSPPLFAAGTSVPRTPPTPVRPGPPQEYISEQQLALQTLDAQVTKRCVKLFRQSVPAAQYTHPGSDLSSETEIWVKDNPQYLLRIRDTGARTSQSMAWLAGTHGSEWMISRGHGSSHMSPEFRRRRLGGNAIMSPQGRSLSASEPHLALPSFASGKPALPTKEDRSKKHWSECGPGAWCNFRSTSMVALPNLPASMQGAALNR